MDRDDDVVGQQPLHPPFLFFGYGIHVGLYAANLRCQVKGYIVLVRFQVLERSVTVVPFLSHDRFSFHISRASTATDEAGSS
jgi:hypothetical protein